MATQPKASAPAKATAAKITSPAGTSATKAEEATSGSATAPANPVSTAVAPSDSRPVNVYAAISLTAGITALCGLVLPSAVIAIVLGHVGLTSAKRGNERGRGSALFGLVVGYLTLVGGFIALIVVLLLGVTFAQQQLPTMINGVTSGITDTMMGSVQEQLDSGGLIQDPATGFVTDPNTGQVFDPNTMQEIDPNTGQPIG